MFGSSNLRRQERRIATVAAVIVAGVSILSGADAARARQADSVTVVAGARYAAGAVERWLLGSRHRDLWTTPIRVPVLWPDTFAGGLALIRRGSSKETLSLHFRGADGRAYWFRSVDKEQQESLPEDVRGTLAATIVRDLVSAKHPGAALVVAPFLQAAGVLHATPRLAVMADSPILEAHREEFAGMLGTIEERPDEPEPPSDPAARNPSAQRGEAGDRAPANGANGSAAQRPRVPYPLGNGDPSRGSPFDRFSRFVGHERLSERVEESSKDRVDARAYLTARLVDLLVGDWDRHPDQWRWARDRRGRTRYWVPIPRDRDNAFSHAAGLIGMIGRGLPANALTYEDRYTSLYAMIRIARPLDEPILMELPRAVWDSTAHELRERITDEVIDAAVAAMPVEWTALDGPALAARLRTRRDALPDVARKVYTMLAREVHVYGTNEADRADIEQRDDGSVRVRLSAPGREGTVYYERIFVPTETREVRVHLGGGPDTAVVKGSGGVIDIRILGGEGDDVFVDASDSARGSRVALYDDSGDDRFVVRPDTRVDRRPYEPPDEEPFAGENAPPPRDWGETSTIFAPLLDFPSIVGPVIGGGPTWTRYGFRRFPYASRFRLAALYAPRYGRFGVEADARFVRERSREEIRLRARATGISVTRFYGFGNETPSDIDSDLLLVWANEYALTAEWTYESIASAQAAADSASVTGAARGVSISVGPILSHTNPSPAAGSPADLTDAVGTRPFNVGGLSARLTIDRRESVTYPRRGAWLEAEAAGYPLVWGDAPEPDPFATAAARAIAYVPLPGALEPTIALRTGAATVSGDAPLQYAAFVGGSSTLRGYSSQRFAGETAVYAGSELRTRLGRANLFVIKGDIGTTLLIDVGRVFVSGQRSREWHAGYGGGLWFAALEGRVSAHLIYAYGEKGILYTGLGLPF